MFLIKKIIHSVLLDNNQGIKNELQLIDNELNKFNKNDYSV